MTDGTPYGTVLERFLAVGPVLDPAGVTRSALKVLYTLLESSAPGGTGSEADRATFDDLVRRGALQPADRGRLLCSLPHLELARGAGLSKNTISRCTKQLARLGLVEKRLVRIRGGLPSNLFLLPEGRTTATAKGATPMETVLTLYEKTIGPATEMIREELAPLVDRYSAEEWDAAFRQAAWSNVLRLSYVVKVLEGRAARRG